MREPAAVRRRCLAGKVEQIELHVGVHALVLADMPEEYGYEAVVLRAVAVGVISDTPCVASDEEGAGVQLQSTGRFLPPWFQSSRRPLART